MANPKEIIELIVTDGWVLVEVNPDSDGYTEMIIEKLEDQRDTMWSTVNTFEISAYVPYVARYDYNIYLKMTKDSVLPKYTFSITRF